mgnify:FL=1|jgi:Domain of Unknown Function (DUF1080).
MKRTLVAVLFLFSLAVMPARPEDGFRPLFDGKTLDGWDGDPRLWKVQDGMIVGSTEGVDLEKNSFLIYRKSTFSDFILRAEVKLRNHNSGIQFRSEALPGWVVKGYQADMAEGNWWGSIYDELGTRGVMVNGWKGKAETVVKPNDWNQMEVTCKGDHIQVRVNGLLTAELHDSAKLEGILALQLHRGPAMQVFFRNIRIKELK